LTPNAPYRDDGRYTHLHTDARHPRRPGTARV